MSFDLNALMKQAQEMQQQMEALQEEAAKETAEASSGGGMVTVVASATGEIRELRIDPKAIDPNDPELLADLVVAAANEALRAAHAKVEAKMKSVHPARPRRSAPRRIAAGVRQRTRTSSSRRSVRGSRRTTSKPVAGRAGGATTVATHTASRGDGEAVGDSGKPRRARRRAGSRIEPHHARLRAATLRQRPEGAAAGGEVVLEPAEPELSRPQRSHAARPLVDADDRRARRFLLRQPDGAVAGRDVAEDEAREAVKPTRTIDVENGGIRRDPAAALIGVHPAGARKPPDVKQTPGRVEAGEAIARGVSEQRPHAAAAGRDVEHRPGGVAQHDAGAASAEIDRG